MGVNSMDGSFIFAFLLPLAGTAVGVTAGSIVTVYVLKERIDSILTRVTKIEDDYIKKENCQDCKAYQLARHNEILRRLEAVEVGVKEAAATVKDCFEELVRSLQPGGSK